MGPAHRGESLLPSLPLDQLPDITVHCLLVSTSQSAPVMGVRQIRIQTIAGPCTDFREVINLPKP